MSSAIEIYNRALSRIGVSDFIGDPNEQSKAGGLYRLWYAACVDSCLRDFPWNFASSVVPLALFSGDPPPGWAYKYAYPVDCHAARVISDSRGMRSLLTNVFQQWDCYEGRYPDISRQNVPFKIMSEADTPATRRRIIVTDMPQAYLFYTAKITDPNLFDPGFADALSWRIAAEIAAPFLGAPTGPTVANTAGAQYRNAVATAKAQSLNESGQDYRPDSPAISARL